MGRVLSTGRAVPDASQARSRLIPLPASRVGAVSITVAQRRELRLRKYLAQGPTALERAAELQVESGSLCFQTLRLESPRRAISQALSQRREQGGSGLSPLLSVREPWCRPQERGWEMTSLPKIAAFCPNVLARSQAGNSLLMERRRTEASKRGWERV